MCENVEEDITSIKHNFNLTELTWDYLIKWRLTVTVAQQAKVYETKVWDKNNLSTYLRITGLVQGVAVSHTWFSWTAFVAAHQLTQN